MTVEAHVSAPPGEDQWINVRAFLVRGEEIIAQGEERLEGEAESNNWNDGIPLEVSRGQLMAPMPLLRLEISPERDGT